MLGVAEGAKEGAEDWRKFLRYLKEPGLKSPRLVVSDCSLGLVNVLAEFYPDAAWQRCVVHWYRNVNADVPKTKTKTQDQDQSRDGDGRGHPHNLAPRGGRGKSGRLLIVIVGRDRP